MKKKSIIVVIGQVSCGKDTFAEKVFPEHYKIDIGTIVRRITKRTQRVHEKRLDADIWNEVTTEIRLHGDKDVIITGMRQLSLFKSVQQLCINRYRLKVYQLVCDYEVRKQRWLDRSDEKDFGLTYDDVIERDDELGLRDLTEYITQNINATQINTNVHENDIVQKIKEWKATAVDY